MEDAVYEDGTPVAMVAAIQNFGAPARGIPARPFFTKMIEEKSPGWGDLLAGLLEKHDWDVVAAFQVMGDGIAGQLRNAIYEMNDPPNSPVTSLLKDRFPKGDNYTFADVLQAWADVADGKSAPAGKPLIWSGHMLDSVTFEVTGG